MAWGLTGVLMAMFVAQPAPPAAQPTATAADAAWLKAVPADAHVVVRVRGLKGALDDAKVMIKAMSPDLGEQAEPALGVVLDQLEAMVGRAALPVDGPGVIVANFPPNQPPVFAWMVKAADPAGFAKAAAGPDGQVGATKGELTEITLSNGVPAFTRQARGFAVVGTDEGLVAALGNNPGGGPPPAVVQALGQGDIAAYVNLEEVNKVYAEQIDAAREQFLQMLAGAPGNEGGQADQIYSGLFEAIKTGKAFVLALDFAAGGLTIDVRTMGLEGRTPVAPVKVAGLGKLPQGMTFYSATTGEATSGMMQWASSMAGTQFGVDQKALKQSEELLKAAGVQESVSGMTMGRDGVSSVAIIQAKDPKALQDALKASRETGAGGANDVVKSVKTGPTQQHRGYTFEPVTVTMDVEKIGAQMTNFPGGAAGFKKLVNDGVMTTWNGNGPAGHLSIQAKDWTAAKALVDAVLDNKGSFGASKGFANVQAGALKDASTVVAISGQGLLDLFATVSGGEVPAGLPKEPALIGVSAATRADGLAFRIVVPSTFGPVVEKGIIPLVAAMVGQINR